jgi:hypothetical protein
MSIVTSQQLSRYFEQYRAAEITFNKQVVEATGLVARNVYLKLQDRQLPCIVYCASMTGARVIADLKAVFANALKLANDRLSLRFCFKLPDKVEPITFFVPCHATGFTHYKVESPDIQIIAMEYTQRAPDDLIQILGTLQEASGNAQKRRDERIAITPETMKKLGLETRDAALVHADSMHRCMLRDLSFGGAKVLVPGLTQSAVGAPVSLRIAKGDQAPEITLPGTICRVEEVGGRTDIVAIGILYSGEPVLTYKLLINSYLSSVRTASKPAVKPAVPAPSPAPADIPQIKEPSDG